MLKPAKLYEEELMMKMRETWYNPVYQFYYSSSYFSDLKLDDDSMWNFVSVDKNDEVIGLFSYHLNREINCVRNFGAISFDIGNVVFARDIRKGIDDIFRKYRFNRMEWCCIDGNPALRSYKKFCENHGGTIVAHEHECVKTLDGALRDTYTFEILARNYKGCLNE